MDELPFAAVYGMLTIYGACWLADDLSWTVSPVPVAPLWGRR